MVYAFQNPELLWLLCLLPVLAWLKGRSGRAAALRFSSVAIARDVAGKSHQTAGRWLFFLRLLALAALIVALARPQGGESHAEVDAEGIDIVLTIDVSGSMRALDMASANEVADRFDIVKRTVESFIKRRPNDRIGLVAFAREAYLVSPVTLNHDWLLQSLERLQIGVIDENGTAIGAALGRSVNLLRDLPGKTKVVVLLTDGEENVNLIPPIAAAEAAAALGIKVYTVAAGTTGRVPMPRIDQNGEIVRDRQGRVVLAGYAPSNIDKETLQRIADLTGARFFSATDSAQLEQIYQEIDQLEKSEVTLRHFSEYTEYFFWPALLGLALLALEQFLRNLVYQRIP